LVATWPLGEAAAISGQCESETKGQASLKPHLRRLLAPAARRPWPAFELFVTVPERQPLPQPQQHRRLLLTASPKLPLSADTEHFACASELRLPFGQPGGSALVLSATKIQASSASATAPERQVRTCALDARSSGAVRLYHCASNTTAAARLAGAAPLLNVTVFKLARVPCLRLHCAASLSILYRLKSGGNATREGRPPATTPRPAGTAATPARPPASASCRAGARPESSFKKASGYALQHLAADYRLSPAACSPNAAEPPTPTRSAFGNGTYFSVASGTAYYSCRFPDDPLDNFVTMETRDLRASDFTPHHTLPSIPHGTTARLSSRLHGAVPGRHAIDNVVPIVVGAALACLVIIVLIAYLIGRRRHSRQRLPERVRRPLPACRCFCLRL
uniref:ZP domain-containing protein n=1 Tax=Macrostomum lignano TaxID=282301 RepID=A0A1I8JRA9_9PLAT